MKKIITVMLVLVVGGLGYFYFTRPQVPEAKNLKVAATIFPLADIARTIFGSQIEVVQVLPTNTSEHTFELTPQLALSLQDADIIFQIGQGLDDNWVEQVTRANPGIKVVTVADGIDLLTAEEHEDENEVEEGYDPHYWLDYDNAKIIAKNMLSAIVAQYPNIDIQQIEDSLSAWLVALDQSKANSLQKIAALSSEQKKMITFHNGWRYFAKEFGLEVVGVFEEFAGRQPTPKELVDLQKIILENNIKVVYSEPQFSPEQLKSLADDLGLEIREMDPVGGQMGKESYIKLMEFNVNAVTQK